MQVCGCNRVCRACVPWGPGLLPTVLPCQPWRGDCCNKRRVIHALEVTGYVTALFRYPCFDAHPYQYGPTHGPTPRDQGSQVIETSVLRLLCPLPVRFCFLWRRVVLIMLVLGCDGHTYARTYAYVCTHVCVFARDCACACACAPVCEPMRMCRCVCVDASAYVSVALSTHVYA